MEVQGCYDTAICQADKYSYINLLSEKVKLKEAEITSQKEIGRHRAVLSWDSFLSAPLITIPFVYPSVIP